MFDSSGTNDVLLPVGRGQIGIADWISGMIHLMVSHIDSYMGNIVAGIVSGMEKDQIASLCLCGSWQADSGFSVAPLSKTRTVKAETTNMVQSNEIFEMADKQGISKRTLENAKKELGIRAKKINNSWYWELDTVKQG